jgi:exonuclease III
MIVVSWNCRGLGNAPKTYDARDLIRNEKPFIILLQETKKIS